ncbi:coiled-coil domain-containing protein [Arsenophonus sp.]|uniref:coiled-coil domain-containing protein n=1 Tax=Arsenophonus sp. TaxID=1872640 RepID=UPI003879879B
MGQVAFDTQEFVETLEKSGLKKEQAKAISIAVRKSHEVADVATKRDLDDVRKYLSAEIADVRKDMEHRFEKNGAHTTAQIALLRKDVESISTWLLIKMAGMMAAIVGIATAIMKFL